MAGYAPIALRVVDEQGQVQFQQEVPFEFEIDVKQVMERAFVLAQTAAQPDPFIYEVRFYGYSEVAQFPGYLGYEVESIQGKQNSQQYFWELKINGVISQEGADSMQPGPGSEVLWTYTPLGQGASQATGHASIIHSRRRSRGAKA